MLRQEHRAVLVLVAEGNHLDEIASILAIPLSTVASRLRRVRELLDGIQKGDEG